MGLFSRKKENKQKQNCCCGETCNSGSNDPQNIPVTTETTIKVLGSGCAKCNELEANVKTALTQLQMNITIEHVTDFSQIAAYGVMSTPALVVNGTVISYGKVLKVEEVVTILKKIYR